MALNQNKNIGAFIFFSKTKEHAFSEEVAEVMDVLTNRFAYFIRHNIRKRRNAFFQTVQTQMLAKHFERDCALIDDFVKAFSAWFDQDQIVILLKHPLDKKRFVKACCTDLDRPHSIENFRTKPLLTDDEVKQYLGNTLQTIENTPMTLNSETEIKRQGITRPCKSWLATPMRLRAGVNLGYLIVYNEQAEYSFEVDEDQFVDGLSDMLALQLSVIRADGHQKALREIKDYLIKDSADIKKLYEKVETRLNTLYGVKNLHIFRYARNNLDFELIHSPEIPDQELLSYKNNALKLIQKSDSNKKLDYKTDLTIENRYFVAPMRIQHRSIGCFMFDAPQIGDFTAKAIDDISDELGELINAQEHEERSQLLNKFGKEFIGIEISFEAIIKKTHEFISAVMFTDNLYIATYDKGKNEISFPYALKDGFKWDAVQGTSRTLDETSKGKTEEIILTGEPILHYTYQESYDWYHEEGKNRKEKAGNYLASWVGVPIFSEEGVIGVIAAYHTILDYLYSERDVFFLQNIAHQVSGLFRALELTEANRKIERSQEHISIFKFHSGIIQYQSERDHANIIELAKQTKDNSNQIFLTGSFKDLSKIESNQEKIILAAESAKKSLKNLLNENAEKIIINIEDLLRKSIDLVKDQIFDAKITFFVNNTVPGFYGQYETLHFTLVKIIKEIITYHKEENDNNEQSLHISVDTKDYQIIIRFLGIEKNFFDNKIKSDFLKKTERSIQLLQGKLKTLKNDHSISISLPINSNNHSANQKETQSVIIYDTEQSWRDIYSSWLSKKHINSYYSLSLKETEALLNTEHSVRLVVLDYAVISESDNMGIPSTINRLCSDRPLLKILLTSRIEQPDLNNSLKNINQISDYLYKFSETTGLLSEDKFMHSVTKVIN